MQVPLSDPIDVAGFHSEARRLLALQVPPETVRWSAAPARSVDEQQLEDGRAVIRNRAARAIIPQSFVRLSELVVLHREPGRFDLLYRVLWRFVHEPGFKDGGGDEDMALLRKMAQSVRRDLQQVKTRTVFEAMVLRGRTWQVAWCEPHHFVAETAARALAQHMAPPWLLLTPDRCVRWDGERLICAPGLEPAQRPGGDWARELEKLAWV